MKSISQQLSKGAFMKGGIVLTALAGSLQFAQAQIPYPDVGTPNSTTYTFTATTTGDIVAYFVAGGQANFENQLGMEVNGTGTGVFGLDNHSTSVGTSIDLGHANAGDTLTFILDNLTLGKMAYSDPSLNVNYDSPGETLGHNHVYSTAYNGTPSFSGVPDGTYVAFEDLPFPGSDFNYNDESFVFTDVTATQSTVPEAASTAGLLGAGFSLLALAKRCIRR